MLNIDKNIRLQIQEMDNTDPGVPAGDKRLDYWQAHGEHLKAMAEWHALHPEWAAQHAPKPTPAAVERALMRLDGCPRCGSQDIGGELNEEDPEEVDCECMDCGHDWTEEA
jgi:hypothetical protein